MKLLGVLLVLAVAILTCNAFRPKHPELYRKDVIKLTFPLNPKLYVLDPEALQRVLTKKLELYFQAIKEREAQDAGKAPSRFRRSFDFGEVVRDYIEEDDDIRDTKRQVDDDRSKRDAGAEEKPYLVRGNLQLVTNGDYTEETSGYTF